MFFSTSVAMIVTELTGVVAVLIDGIIASRFLGVDVYSGISLLKPFSGIVMVFASLISVGCNIVCSRLVGLGEKEEANRAFNLSILLALLLGMLFVFASLFFPTALLHLCGVSLDKYPELNPYLFSYLKGYTIGIPAIILVQVLSPALVMSNGKKRFTFSSIILCLTDILGDLLNVMLFKGGAFGMGAASSLSYIVQLLMLLPCFLKKESFFLFSFRSLNLRHLPDIVRNGSPSLIKRTAGTFRDILINYINIRIAISSAAIAARGIQNDLFQFFFNIPSGMGRTMLTMAGIYYGANDLKGLKRLYSYGLGLGFRITGSFALLVFLFAPQLVGIYTADAEVLQLAVFSIRCMAAALVFDTVAVILQYYLQGIGDIRRTSLFTFCERFAVPVLCAVLMGTLYGSKGLLSSVALSKFVLMLLILLINCIRYKKFPTDLEQIMFLPDGFGGSQSDNFYAKIGNVSEAIEASVRTQDFALQHNVDGKQAMLAGLFVEELTVNVLEHAKKKGKDNVSIDFRLFISDTSICLSMTDLGDLFDPTSFHELHQYDSPEEHIGIRTVMKAAKEVRYFSTFTSNNLTVYLDR